MFFFTFEGNKLINIYKGWEIKHTKKFQVEEVAQDLDELEAMIEPLVDKNEANAETKQQGDEKEANSKPSRY